MLDSTARKLIDPPLNKIAIGLSKIGLTGTSITLLGFGFGIVACVFAIYQCYLCALLFLIINRVFDGLDGAVARTRNEASDFGGYLDIVLDFFI
jgi:phosphatidylglycerophosphate synthase